jgi:hypothetical protein
MGIFFGLDGALVIGEANQWRARKSFYIPAMIGGITSCLFCVLIYSYMKGAMYSTIAELLALTFIIRGATLAYFAYQAKNYVPPGQPGAVSAVEPPATGAEGSPA